MPGQIDKKTVRQPLSSVGEFGLIKMIKDGLFPPKTKKFAKTYGLHRFIVKGIGDDAAVIKLNNRKYMLFTTDMIVEGVHFAPDTPPRLIGRKAMSANISDIAAMGGVPQYAVVSLGISGQKPVSCALGIYEGIKEICRNFNVVIVGGDTVKSGKLVINVALLGEVSKKDIVTRAGAKNGEMIYVTGELGNSLPSGWHLRFRPRMTEVQYLLRKFHPTAMIDITDGLISDLNHILEQSAVGAEIYSDKVPLRKGAALRNAFYDGEDYEMLFTLSPRNSKTLMGLKKARFPFFPVGRITKDAGEIVLVDKTQKSLEVEIKGYAHF